MIKMMMIESMTLNRVQVHLIVNFTGGNRIKINVQTRRLVWLKYQIFSMNDVRRQVGQQSN